MYILLYYVYILLHIIYTYNTIYNMYCRVCNIHLQKLHMKFTMNALKIFLIIFKRIGTFFRNTQKYVKSLHLFSEFFIQLNSEIF